MAYTTLADVKTYLGIESANTNDDALLSGMIERAQSMIDASLSRTFEAAADTTRTLDAIADVYGQMLYLNDDLCALTAVANGDGVTIPLTELVTEPRIHTPFYALRLKQSSAYYWTYTDTPEGAIAVTGRWAYSVTAPGPIVQAAIRLTAWLYKQKSNVADIAAPAVSPTGEIIIPAAMPLDIRQLLTPYRWIA